MVPYSFLIFILGSLISAFGLISNPSTPLDIRKWSVQGTEISSQRPWKRATIHSLIQEVTGIDFASSGDDIGSALSFFEGHIERRDSGTIRKSPSIGHLVNEIIAKDSHCQVIR